MSDNHRQTLADPAVEIFSGQPAGLPAGPGISQALRTYIQSGDLRADFERADPAYRREKLKDFHRATAAGFVGTGWVLWEINRIEGGAACKRAAEEASIGWSWAKDAMRAFRKFNELPNLDVIAAIGDLGPSKAAILGDFSPEELTALAQGQSVRGVMHSELIDTSRRDLQEQLKAWREAQNEEVQGLREQLARSEAARLHQATELQTTTMALQYRSGQDLPPWYHDVRIESAACAETIDASLTALENLASNPLLRELAGEEDEQLYLRQAAAGLIYHGLATTAVRITKLLRLVESLYGPQVTGAHLSMHLFALEGEELKAATERRAAVLRQVELARLMRQAAQPGDVQAALAPRGRGRPAGSKNKAKAKA